MSLLTAAERTWFASLRLGQMTQVQPFAAARTNQVFLLTLETSAQYVFKRLNLFARDPGKRAMELAVQGVATEHGISAQIVADNGRYRLQHYIQGEVLGALPVSDAMIELLAAQLYRVHQLPAEHASPQSLSGELQRLNCRLVKGTDQDEFSHFLKQATELEQGAVKDTLCHGDLSFNNLIQTPSGAVKILDWEYAVRGCPAYDLASSCAINHFNAQQQEQLLCHYYQLNGVNSGVSLSLLRQQTTHYLAVFTYLNQLWEVCFRH